MTEAIMITVLLACVVAFVINHITLRRFIDNMQQRNVSQNADQFLVQSLQETSEANHKLLRELMELKDRVNAIELKKTQEDANPNIKGMAGNILLGQMLAEIYGENTKGRFWDTEYNIAGIGRPDAVVMYKDKIIPIDSKNHKDDYVAYMQGSSNLKNLTTTLIRSAKDVAKYISPSSGTSHTALMFIPSEQMYYDVFVANFDNTHVQNLRRECQKMDIVLCSPSTLYVELTRIFEQIERNVVMDNISIVFEMFRNVGDIMDRNIAQLDAWETRFKNVLSEIQSLRNVNTKMQKNIKSIDKEKAT